MGRKPKFNNEEELQEACESYEDLVPTKAGLMFHLGIYDRVTMLSYQRKYPNTINKAYMLIEIAWNKRLNQSAPIGAIFYLKNAYKKDYQEKYDSDITVRQPKPLLDVLHKKGSK